MKLSVIILTYNSSRFIPELLSGFVEQYKKEISSHTIEIIIADNNSTDDTKNEVMKFKEYAHFVQNGGNLGFAAGINKASEEAAGEVLLFLNPDTKLTDGDFIKVVEELQNEKVGVIGGEMQTWDGKREYSCGKFYTFLNILLLSLGLEEICRVRFAPTRRTQVDHVSGGFFAIRRDLFQKMGGFDEHFFMYVEDQELCYRLKKEGYKVYYSPFATIKHMGQGSSNRTFAIVNIYKGLLYFQKKHMGAVSYSASKFVLRLKAHLLVLLGKTFHNQYLSQTYEEALDATR